jgi:hypothetical protein
MDRCLGVHGVKWREHWNAIHIGFSNCAMNGWLPLPHSAWFQREGGTSPIGQRNLCQRSSLFIVLCNLVPGNYA